MPVASVAVHVLVIVPVPSGFMAATSLNEIAGDGSLSVAVAVPVADGSVESPTSTVTSAGTVITGAVVSSIVII